MSGFFKTVSSLRQNFSACLAIAGREAFVVFEKAGGGSVKEGRGRKPRGLATSCYHRGAPGIIPWGWGGSQRVAFCSVKVPIFFAGQPWSEMPCRLTGRKPASQTPPRWVARLCVDRLSVVD